MLLNLFSIAFFVVALWLTYLFLLRPILRSRPELKEFYGYTDSFWTAAWGKFAFIKSKLLAMLMMALSGIISLHDFLLPASVGIDWTPLTSKVPDWSWPIISFVVAALFYWFHQLKEREQAMVTTAVAAGTPVAETKMLLDLPAAVPPPGS